MALGRKTGGAPPWPKGVSGNPRGRPLGAKDRIPRGVRKTLQQVCAEIGPAEQALLKAALLRGLAGPNADRYIRIFGEYGPGGPPARRTALDIDLSRLTADELETLEALLKRAERPRTKRSASRAGRRRTRA